MWPNGGEKPKSTNLKPVMRLKYYNFINGLFEWVGR